MSRKHIPVVLSLLLAVAVAATAGTFFFRNPLQPPAGGEVRVAAASNFMGAARELAERFEEETGCEVVLSFGSTGMLYAQIRNGAPYDVFLSADAEHPGRLEEEGNGVAGSRFTYAVGKLVLWSPKPGFVVDEGKVLERGEFRHLAVANPELAPYGEAAREVLEGRGLWTPLRQKIVRGENVAQAFHFVKSGNAQLGFVAASQAPPPDHAAEGSIWEVPQSLYTPIEQQGVLLHDIPAARRFLEFLKSEEAREAIRGYGYEVSP